MALGTEALVRQGSDRWCGAGAVSGSNPDESAGARPFRALGVEQTSLAATGQRCLAFCRWGGFTGELGGYHERSY